MATATAVQKVPIRRPSTFFLSAVLAAGAAASFASPLILGQRDLWRRHAGQEAEEIIWAVFLKDGVDRTPVEDMLRALPGLRSLRFVSKDEALESAKTDPVFADGFSLTGGNPFPESFTAQWAPLFLRPDLLDHHAERVRELPAVDQVDYDRPRVERFALAQKALSRLDLALETLTAAAAALLLAMAGRLLFFAAEPPSPSVLAGGALAGLAGAAAGAGAALHLGMSAGVADVGAGMVVAGLLALGSEAFRS